MTGPWVAAAAAAGLASGPPLRAAVFRWSLARGSQPRRACPRRRCEIAPARRALTLPASGRCPACRVRLGPPPLAVEAAAGISLAISAAKASSAWELAALAWLACCAVVLACVDAAVRRLPDGLTAASFAGTFGLLAAGSIADGHLAALGRAALAGAALTGFYLALFVIRPDGIGLGDAKFAASVGTMLGWFGWQTVAAGTFAGFLLAAVYGLVLVATRRAAFADHLPLGPFIAVGALAAIAL